jgi:hypothetical protein
VGGGGGERLVPDQREIGAKKMGLLIHRLSASGTSGDFLSEPKDVVFCMCVCRC